MGEQLSFDLPVRSALGREDFYVAPANEQAVAMIEDWQGWPSRKLVLAGPPGAGKTHLTHVWTGLSGATIIAARDLAEADIAALATGQVAVEDADEIAGNGRGEEALFHLHNLTLAEGHSLMITAQSAPNFWPLALPDLASRMQATTLANLRAPDDTLLAALLMKLFADRQLSPNPEILPYLARRMDRSFDAARRLVATLDATALSTGRPITRAMAAKVLDNMAE